MITAHPLVRAARLSPDEEGLVDRLLPIESDAAKTLLRATLASVDAQAASEDRPLPDVIETALGELLPRLGVARLLRRIRSRSKEEAHPYAIASLVVFDLSIAISNLVAASSSIDEKLVVDLRQRVETSLRSLKDGADELLRSRVLFAIQRSVSDVSTRHLAGGGQTVYEELRKDIDSARSRLHPAWPVSIRHLYAQPTTISESADEDSVLSAAASTSDRITRVRFRVTEDEFDAAVFVLERLSDDGRSTLTLEEFDGSSTIIFLADDVELARLSDLGSVEFSGDRLEAGARLVVRREHPDYGVVTWGKRDELLGQPLGE